MPVVLSVSPRRWNGRKTRSQSSGGMPGPAVDDPDLDPVAEPAAGQVRGPFGGRVAQGVGAEVGHDPLQQSGVGLHERKVLGRRR